MKGPRWSDCVRHIHKQATIAAEEVTAEVARMAEDRDNSNIDEFCID